jgi:hypothetical protein
MVDDLAVLEARALLPDAEKAVALAEIAERRTAQAWREAREAAQRRAIDEAAPRIREITGRLYAVLFETARPFAMELHALQRGVARRTGLTPPTPDVAWLLPTDAGHESGLDAHARAARAEGRLLDR